MSISLHTSGQQVPRAAEPAAPAIPTAVAQQPAQAAQAAPLAYVAKFNPQEEVLKREELSKAIEHLNEMMRKQGRDLSFSMDDKLNRTIIQVRSATTGEVVRQIPDETVLKVAHSIEAFKGLLLNERG